jgi:hypothetical protein
MFRRRLRSKIVQESSSTTPTNVEFECEFYEIIEKITWFRSKVERLSSSNKYQIESLSNGLIHRLTIFDVNLNDNDEYVAAIDSMISLATLTVEKLSPSWSSQVNSKGRGRI